MEEKLLTKEEVAAYLGISIQEVENLAKAGQMTAYKIGGRFLRFKKSQVEEFGKRQVQGSSSQTGSQGKQGPSLVEGPFLEKIKDFFYFYDFYIISALIIVLIIYIILH